jgi:hypothetical protein
LQEKVALRRQSNRIASDKPMPRLSDKPVPRLKQVKDQPGSITLNYPVYMIARGTLSKALGTADWNFVGEIISQLVAVSANSHGVDEKKLNFLLSVIKGIDSNDQIETMLAVQMAVVHMTAMEFAQHFSLIDSLPQQDSAERIVNRLMRTFVQQLEALKRHRTGGEQKVTVQHVSVGEGGQAIVGNVTQAARENKSEAPRARRLALTDAREEAMPILDQSKREAVPRRRKQMDGKQTST